MAWALAVGCGASGGRVVVVYASQDQVYAGAILDRFSRETGIRVEAIYDSEAVKTVGLANRLLTERAHPRCDLFWNNEAVRTQQLAAAGLFRETNGWAAFGYRSRRLVVNTNRVSVADAPKSLRELTNEEWNGKVALAYPLFGTTAAHFLALRREWGEASWRQWCERLRAGGAKLFDGNSVVVRMVGRGEAWVGLTDYDDVASAQRAGLPVEALPLTGELLLVPNTVGVIRGAPHPAEAEALFEFLRRPDVVKELVSMNALEGASPVKTEGLRADWGVLAKDLDETMKALEELFLR